MVASMKLIISSWVAVFWVGPSWGRSPFFDDGSVLLVVVGRSCSMDVSVLRCCCAWRVDGPLPSLGLLAVSLLSGWRWSRPLVERCSSRLDVRVVVDLLGTSFESLGRVSRKFCQLLPRDREWLLLLGGRGSDVKLLPLLLGWERVRASL